MTAIILTMLYKEQFNCVISLFNGISTFLGYLIPKPSFYKNSSDTT